MKKLNLLLGGIFLLLALLSLYRGDRWAEATLALLAAGFALSDLRVLSAADAGVPAPGAGGPVWRRYSSIALVALALFMLGLQLTRGGAAPEPAVSGAASPR